MKIQMLKKILVAISLALGAQCSKEKPTATMSKPSLSALTLSSVVDTLISKTQGHAASAKAIQQKLGAALAAATAPNAGDLGKAAMPVALVLAKNIGATSANKIESLERLAYAATKLANITGHQFGIKDAAGLKVPNFSKGQADPTTSNDGNANIYVEAGPATYKAADQTTYNTAAAKAADWATPEGFDEIKIYTLTALTTQGSTARAPVIGKGSGGDVCTNNAVSNGPATNTHICVVGGDLITATPTTYTKATKNYNSPSAGEFNTGNFEHYVSQALAAAASALQPTTTISSTFDPDDISNYASDEDFKAAIGLQYLGLHREKAIGTASEAVTGVIKATYGTGSEMKNKFWDKLKTIKKPSKILGTDQTGDISGVTDLTTAIMMLLEEKVKVSKQKQQEKTPETPTDQKGSGDKATENKDGTNKTTTNTTASNSFVISKAPLLLAVLLFLIFTPPFQKNSC
uniref:Variant surface glycoprotein 1125.4765 n=1 Tax=Trypanosoma brucei TaxID=5691 RepID=A0A1J0RAS6_9TRYP|nr:variant surface glycoprotein 1125.4765 [Trypanosoma brucei]